MNTKATNAAPPSNYRLKTVDPMLDKLVQATAGYLKQDKCYSDWSMQSAFEASYLTSIYEAMSDLVDNILGECGDLGESEDDPREASQLGLLVRRVQRGTESALRWSENTRGRYWCPLFARREQRLAVADMRTALRKLAP